MMDRLRITPLMKWGLFAVIGMIAIWSLRTVRTQQRNTTAEAVAITQSVKPSKPTQSPLVVTSGGKRPEGKLPLEQQKKLGEIKAALGLQNDLLTKPYSDNAINLLVKELENEELKIFALQLLTQLIEVEFVPLGRLQNRIRPAIQSIIAVESVRASGIDEERSQYIMQLAEDILWHQQVQNLSQSARVSFLKQHLVGTSKYRFDAIRYLVKIGNPVAMQALQDALQSMPDHLKNSDTFHGLQLGIDEINFSWSLQSLSPQQQADALFSKLHEGYGGIFKGEYEHWLLQKLESVKNSVPVETLQTILADTTYESNVRLWAQEMLIQQGQLNPNQRVIITIE